MSPDATVLTGPLYGLPNLTEKDLTQVSLSVAQFVAEYDISSLDDRVQIREVKHVAPRDRVGEYAARMKVETTPPILVTRDGWIVDGNTRIAAAHKIKRQFLPAVVLDADYGPGSAPKERLRIEALAAKANRHGEALDKREKREFVSKAVREGWTQDVIGMMVGVTPAVVAQINEEVRASGKLDRVGLQLNGALPSSSLRALGKISDLNDDPFRAIAELTSDAGLNGTEIKDLGKRAKEAQSDQEALKLIQVDRSQNAERIAEHKLTGAGKPPIARGLRQHLGFVLNHGDHPENLVEQSDLYKEQHLSTLRSAVTVLNAVLALQEKAPV